MFATWLLPYNEMVAAWVDPWYDAGNASHTNIMGSVGANTIFYNVGNFHADADFDYAVLVQVHTTWVSTDVKKRSFNTWEHLIKYQ